MPTLELHCPTCDDLIHTSPVKMQGQNDATGFTCMNCEWHVVRPAGSPLTDTQMIKLAVLQKNKPTAREPDARTVRFDPEKLYAAIDRKRRSLRITWREVHRRIGEKSPAALGRIGQGRSPSVDLFLRLLVWLGDTDVTNYASTIAEPPAPAPDGEGHDDA